MLLMRCPNCLVHKVLKTSAAPGRVRGEFRRQVLRPARRDGSVLGSGGALDRRRPQVPPGGTGSSAEALSKAADVRGDPQFRNPVASPVLLQSLWWILGLPGSWTISF